MSAFVVDKKHIDALLTYASRPEYQSPSCYYWLNKIVYFYDEINRIGNVLVFENYHSVNYRYNDHSEPFEYKWERYTRSLTPIQIVKACDCLDYQSCETPDWKETEANTIIQSIRERAIREIPGYETASWEITENIKQYQHV
jgi:hypothetical protein